MKFLKTLISIICLVLIFDLIINLILPNSIKKKIGTTKNYSLKSERFHHEISNNIDLPELWGEIKYQVVTNQYGMRIGKNYKIDKNKPSMGFMGDSFVYGSGINYDDHFIQNLIDNNKNYNFLNLAYVSYSPSIYYKKLKYFIDEKKINFHTIYLFIDTSDIQDEGIFYREDKNGNIVRKWNSDKKNESKNIKYKFKNYFKQNSFIFKFFEIFNTSTVQDRALNCIKNKNSISNFNKYLDYERFGYGFDKKIQEEPWVHEGKKKVLFYLSKINKYLISKNINLVLVYYPSAIEILEETNLYESEHYKLLKAWANEHKIKFIDTTNEFNLLSSGLDNYKINHILCDAHWNQNGHNIIAKNILKHLNM